MLNKIIPLLAFCILILVPLGMQNAEAALCTAPNSGGTVTNPISSCNYASNPADPMRIINGLPAGDTIQLVPSLEDLPLVPATVVNNGGNLGGEIELDTSGILFLDIDGTGSLSFFQRSIFVPVDIEAHTAPRNAVDPIQSFATEMVKIDGEIFGDPDFCTFRIKAGSSIPLPPSSGQTQLTDLLNGNFQVDSFFDITYTIEFEGCPGSALEGMSGTTQGIVKILTQDLDGDGLPDGQDHAPNNPCDPNPNSPSCNKSPIAGEIIPIEAISLLLANSQSFSWMIPVLLSGIGIGLFAVSRKPE